MDNPIMVMLICQGSAMVLNEVCKKRESFLENNGKYLSPKDKERYNQKIRILGFFEKLLKIGGILYFILVMILNFGRLIIK